MPWDDCAPSNPGDTIWDVVIVGTGAGGGPAGLTLARRGKSVLFIERGEPWDGITPASRTPRFHSVAGRVHSETGSYGQQGAEDQEGAQPTFTVGHAIGGSTAVFAMVMDRFRPVDLTPHRFAHLAPGSLLPVRWPIEYEELEPYYAQAESLFRVRGSADPLTPARGPLREPLPPSDTESRMCQTLARGGLHPYALHYAREYLEGCDGCPNGPCPRACKNDAGRMCVVPAIESHGAHLLTSCLAMKLETRGRAVTAVVCLWKGERVSIKGRIFILAANALSTPVLLLRSANESFPQGIGNSSGMVGCNLMTHVSDWLAVRDPDLDGAVNGRLRNGISLNDFYFRDGVKLGNIHAHAMELAPLLQETDPRLRPGVPAAGITLFATVVEDFPYPQNRVMAKSEAEDRMSWEYHYPDELRARSAQLVSAFSRAIPDCEVVVRQPSGLLNPAHLCGTCRFGDDPRTSVLDRENRVHELDNLFVLDASFFPSSGGINPSLTIVANSLRVGALIAR